MQRSDPASFSLATIAELSFEIVVLAVSELFSYTAAVSFILVSVVLEAVAAVVLVVAAVVVYVELETP